jgi:hypothetical protein
MIEIWLERFAGVINLGSDMKNLGSDRFNPLYFGPQNRRRKTIVMLLVSPNRRPVLHVHKDNSCSLAHNKHF